MNRGVKQAVVLAGGGGPHLRPLTRDRPRAMLPVLGKPIAARVMERVRLAGVREFIVVLDEQGGQLAAYLKQSWYADLVVNFGVQPAGSPLDVALAQAANQLDGSFVLIGADVLAPNDFVPKLVRWFEMSGKDMVLGLGQTHFSHPGSYFPVQVTGDTVAAITSHTQDMPDATYGAFPLCVCAPKLLPYLTGENVRIYHERDLAGAIQCMIDAGAQVGYMLADWFVRLQRVEDLLGFNRFLLEEGTDAHILSELPESVRVLPPVRVDPNVSVGPRAQLGPDVYLEAGSTVGQGAHLSDTVVMAGGVVEAGAQVRGRVVASVATASGT